MITFPSFSLPLYSAGVKFMTTGEIINDNLEEYADIK